MAQQGLGLGHARVVAFAQAGGGVDSESVRTTEGKVPHRGAGPEQRPKGCLVSATCGVPDGVHPEI